MLLTILNKGSLYMGVLENSITTDYLLLVTQLAVDLNVWKSVSLFKILFSCFFVCVFLCVCVCVCLKSLV